MFDEFRRGTLFLVCEEEEDEEEEEPEEEEGDETSSEYVVSKWISAMSESGTEVARSESWGWSSAMASSTLPREHNDSHMYVNARNLREGRKY